MLQNQWDTGTVAALYLNLMKMRIWITWNPSTLLKRINASVWQKVEIGGKTNLAARSQVGSGDSQKAKINPPHLFSPFLRPFQYLWEQQGDDIHSRNIPSCDSWTSNEFLQEKIRKCLHLKQGVKRSCHKEAEIGPRCIEDRDEHWALSSATNRQ